MVTFKKSMLKVNKDGAFLKAIFSGFRNLRTYARLCELAWAKTQRSLQQWSLV